VANSKRKTILDYLRDTTLAAITTAGGYNFDVGNVSRGIEPVDALPDSSFPALYITGNRAVRNNISRLTVKSLLQVVIECYVKRSGDTNGLQSDLDNLIEDVSEALEQDRTLGGNCDHLEIQEVVADDGDLAPHAVAAIAVEIQYHAEGTAV